MTHSGGRLSLRASSGVTFTDIIIIKRLPKASQPKPIREGVGDGDGDGDGDVKNVNRVRVVRRITRVL